MKGQGLPISTIIIAALGIIVLVVIGAIFSGQIRKFGQASNECPGTCVRSDGQPPLYRQATECQGFETEVGGTTFPRGLPKIEDPAKQQCQKCCIVTG